LAFPDEPSFVLLFFCAVKQVEVNAGHFILTLNGGDRRIIGIPTKRFSLQAQRRVGKRQDLKDLVAENTLLAQRWWMDRWTSFVSSSPSSSSIMLPFP
jgi:hypothetical protein